MEAQPFVIEKTFDAPAGKIWKAITDKDEMELWYFDLQNFKPEVGFQFHFDGGSEKKTYRHNCTVTEAVTNEKLTYSWSYDGYPGMSYVTFELFEEGDKTRLKLTHSGLASFPQNSPDFAAESFAAGWTHIIGTSLAGYLKKH